MIFEKLKQIQKPTYQNGSAKSLEEFYEVLIKNQFKHNECIKKIHNSILEYVEVPNPTFFLRLYGSFKRRDYEKQRRGFLTKYKSGINISYCDNTFSLIFSGMKLSGISFEVNDLINLLSNKKLVTGFAQVSKEKELAYYTPKGAVRYDLNTKGWYQAHIKPTGKDFGSIKSLKKMFPNPPREEFNSNTRLRVSDETLTQEQLKVLKAHFVRLIHPLNSFLVPKKEHLIYNGINIGEEANLISLVRHKISEQFPKEIKEFDLVSMEYQFNQSEKIIENIRWNTTPIQETNKPKKINKINYIQNNIMNSGLDYIMLEKTRFYVDEMTYKYLLKNQNRYLKIIVTPKRGKHPKGTYNISNKNALLFIESKRNAYNWEKNQNYHQDSIPTQLKQFFSYD